MFKLIKLGIGLVGLATFCWFGLTVPLGDHTLFGHLSAIGKSKESQELVRGTKEKVGDLKKRIAGSEKAEKAEKTAVKPADKVTEKDEAPAEKAPQERLTHVDRKEIRHFIDSARSKLEKSTDKTIAKSN